MKIEVTKTTMVDHCYHQCPHFDIDGGPSGAMMCSHPEIERRYEKTGDLGVFYIISHPECDDGFPKKCPLLKRARKGRTKK